MTFAQRGRSLSVSGFLLAGAIGIISSDPDMADGRTRRRGRGDPGPRRVRPGAARPAEPGGAGARRRAVDLRQGRPSGVGVLAGATALFLGWSTLQLLLAEPFDAVAATVTEVTGLAGGDAVREVVVSIVPSAWPFIALVGWALLLLASVVVLVTWRGWKVGGRRYRTDHVEVAHDGPVDAVDSWDELSRGTDPTR